VSVVTTLYVIVYVIHYRKQKEISALTSDTICGLFSNDTQAYITALDAYQ